MPVAGEAGSTSTSSYYLPCQSGGETAYLSCSVGLHCEYGQKLAVYTSRSSYAYAPSPPATPPSSRPLFPASSDAAAVVSVDDTAPAAELVPLLHVTSMAEVMTLLGFARAADGTTTFSRGYQTEALASKTVEYIVRRLAQRLPAQ